MAIMAGHNRKPPAFRLRDVLGPSHRPTLEHWLAKELHRQFDAIAADTPPQPIFALVDRLQAGSDRALLERTTASILETRNLSPAFPGWSVGKSADDRRSPPNCRFAMPEGYRGTTGQ